MFRLGAWSNRMSQTETKVAPPKVEEKKDNRSRVAEILQGPRRKRRSYVFLALKPDLAADFGNSLEAFVKSTFKQLGVSRPETQEDFRKAFTRQISLLVYDDQFLPQDIGFEMLAELKRKSTDGAVPVLFLTRDPRNLVDVYNQRLAPFQENDDYLDIRRMSNAELFSRIKTAVQSGNQRRSRRYRANIDLTYTLLGTDLQHQAKIFDLSMHGALLRDEAGRIFHDAEQLRLSIPLGKVADLAEGEYLKLSCRVRRTFMVGKEAGVSFEYLTDEKSLILAKIITGLANAQNLKRPPTLKVG
jgi:PilZ domain